MSFVLPITKTTTSKLSTKLILSSSPPSFLIPFLSTISSFPSTSFITSTASTSSTSSLLLSTLTLPSFTISNLSPRSIAEDGLKSLRDLLPPWLLAVPKSKTSHSKKSMRSSGKGLKEQNNIVSCPSCGTPKKSHHLCHDCHVDYRREYHAAAKEELKAKSQLEALKGEPSIQV